MSEQTTMNTEDTVMFQERKRILFLGLPWTFTKYTITADQIGRASCRERV